jgi:hypothetical protein
MIKSHSILLTAAILGGCSVSPVSIDGCPSPQRVTPINIGYQQQNNMVQIQVAPNHAEVDRGDLIRFKVNGNLGKTVTVSGKATDPDASWIAGSATSGHFDICVTTDKIVNQTYSYMVEVDGIGILDPEVRVKR